jgi:Rrf2 family nitric oxide-sensitive transcriptional repressor
MRLTLHTDYALRVLMHLGRLPPGGLASIREVADAHRISENHLVKVVHGLGRAGFVATLRGRGGGLRLAKAPGEIRVGDVVRWAEEDMALVACFRPDGPPGGGCVLAGACRLQSLLGEALGAFMAVLDRATLADLLPRPRPGTAARPAAAVNA